MTIPKFYDLETQKLNADGELVALFTTHGPTLGAFRESRLRAYLKDHVARRYRIASGFISDYDEVGKKIISRSSNQIDCLIYDPTDHVPLIESDAFAAMTPVGVAGFVEVKSDLKLFKEKAPQKAPPCNAYPFCHDGVGYKWAGTLVDALENILSAIAIMKDAGVDRGTFFAGIISYDGDGLNQFAAALKSGELVRQLGLQDIDDLPDCICVLRRGWWVSAYEWRDIDPEEESLDYDQQTSVLNAVKGTSLDGAPLQLFTALLSHTLESSTNGSQKKIGGLRSSVGRRYEIENTRFGLPCPGKGPA